MSGGSMMYKESNRMIDAKTKDFVLKLKQKEYFDYNCRHFFDILVSEHEFKHKYQTIWRWLKGCHMVKNPKARRRRKQHIPL